ncbi:UNVERIFIED_CONTAM: hypothetical protein Sradi_6089700 [Sesamum radiatum]|uniref:Uncharacterized protein n=1 Tax=Sesamum radiatum TaxID=300843 RepID=A0AAW2KIR2_SESRA
MPPVGPFPNEIGPFLDIDIIQEQGEPLSVKFSAEATPAVFIAPEAAIFAAQVPSAAWCVSDDSGDSGYYCLSS